MGARPRFSTCSASSPTLETPGPSKARGECPQRPRSLEVVQLVRSRGWVLTWGPQRQEYAGCPQGGEVRGRRVCGQLSPRCLPGARRVVPRSSARDRGRRVRVPPAARAVAERGAGGAAAVVFEARSPKQRRLGGGKGEGQGPGRGAAARRGLRRSRVRVCGPGHPLSRSGQGLGPTREREREESGLG